MAIQMKRGKLSELDTSLLQAGEMIVATDTDFVAYAKAPSDIVPLATKKEVINSIKGATLVDVVDGCFTFKHSRSQPKLSYIRDYEVGNTYDVEYGDGVDTVEYALYSFLKCVKPELVRRGIYDVIKSAIKAIFRELKNIVGNNDLVYVSCTSYTSFTQDVIISVNYGTPRTNEFKPSSVDSISNQKGRLVYWLNPQVYINGEARQYNISPTGEYTVSTRTPNSVQRLGVSVDATSLSVSNLGMKTDRVINDNDWEWDFSNCEQKQIQTYDYGLDLVDGLLCQFTGNATGKAHIEDDCLVIPSNYAACWFPYLFQMGRTVEIDFGICERHYDQTEYYTSYPSGVVFGNYISTASQYAIPFYGLEMESYSVGSSQPKMRIRGLYSSSDSIEVADPNFLSEKKVISKMENNTWTITIGDKSLSYEYSPYGLVYSKIGWLNYSNAYALYITRIKKIKVN